MNSDQSISISAGSAVWAADGVGIFTWDVAENILWGDPVIADMFGLDADEAQAGLPLQAYLTRLHKGDAPRVAKAIHQAIESGEPYQQEYRLVGPGGEVTWVLAIGHCFRDRNDMPSNYAGVVYDVTSQKTLRTDGIRYHCQAALDVANLLGNPRLIALLRDAATEARAEDSKAPRLSENVH